MNPGTTTNYTYGVNTLVAPNTVYLHPLAGGGFAGSGPADLSSSSFTDSSKRFMTAKTNAVGIRIFATGQTVSRSGTLTLGILPGIS